MPRPAVLIVAEDSPARSRLEAVVQRRRVDVRTVRSWEAALRDGVYPLDLLIAQVDPDRAEETLDAVRQLRGAQQNLPVIFVVSHSSEELAVRALRLGVTDYVRTDSSIHELETAVTRGLEAVRPAPNPAEDAPLLEIVGNSSAMRRAKDSVQRLALSASNVLLVGETGTGKELAAQTIHYNSPRRSRPFVCINCAAIPDCLLESELFGYEKGAFTGAQAPQPGKLRLADTGTVFFDEIGDMSPHAQAKLLRAIENREVYSLGGRYAVHVDIRIIAATNQDLEALSREGRFRKDLLFRLDVAHVHLPALRECKPDIPLLVDHFLRQFNHRFGCQVEGCTPAVLNRLVSYDWPGNVRELRNVVEAMFLSRPDRWISMADLPERLRRACMAADELPPDERDRLITALFTTNWNISQAAHNLHWSRMTLYRKLAKYQIARQAPGTGESQFVTAAGTR